MNSDQRNGIVREMVFSLLAVLVSFDVLGGSHVDSIAAAVIALSLLIWGLIAKPTDVGAFGSLVRKAIHAISPVLLEFGVITPSQSASLTFLAAVIVTTWSIQANEPVPEQRSLLGK